MCCASIEPTATRFVGRRPAPPSSPSCGGWTGCGRASTLPCLRRCALQAVTIHEVDYLPRGSALRRALLGGYRQVRDLSPAHETMIDTFSMLRELQITTWFLQERDNPSF